MRWIFYTLLVVNVGLFGYVQWRLPYSISAQERNVHLSVHDLNLPSLILLNELQQVGSETENRGISHRSLCTLIGPFVTKSNASLFSRKLASLGVNAKIKNLLVSSTVGFWLHLPPQPSRKEVLRRLSELQRQGVDSYIIPDGDLANGISLGMFSDKERADMLKKRIGNLGYSPEILSVPREKRELWLLLSQADMVKISTERWLELLSGKDLLQKQQNLCSDVAST